MTLTSRKSVRNTVLLTGGSWSVVNTTKNGIKSTCIRRKRSRPARRPESRRPYLCTGVRSHLPSTPGPTRLSGSATVPEKVSRRLATPDWVKLLAHLKTSRNPGGPYDETPRNPSVLKRRAFELKYLFSISLAKLNSSPPRIPEPLTPVVLAAIGHRSSEDQAQHAPKFRRALSELFEEV